MAAETRARKVLELQRDARQEVDHVLNMKDLPGAFRGPVCP
jgi:hypothetical protein